MKSTLEQTVHAVRMALAALDAEEMSEAYRLLGVKLRQCLISVIVRQLVV